MAGIICTPLFHCPRCRDHWAEFGTVPEDCKFKRQPTRGPAIHMARGRKPRVEHRKKKMKKRLGFVDKISSVLTFNLVSPQTLYVVLSSSRSQFAKILTAGDLKKVRTQGGGPEPASGPLSRLKKNNSWQNILNVCGQTTCNPT